MSNYFSRFDSVESIKSEYRRLAMLHHPDRGGDTATMQAINAEYQTALKRCNGQTAKGSDGAEHTYRYNEAVEREVMEALQKILRIKMTAYVALIGTWIWILGDTKPVKDSLKAIGCMWHAKRMAWYWRPAEQKAYRQSRGNLADIADRYGVRMFHTTDTETAVA